jgi:predicted anti-sigma-YlaC factor YlaD
MNHRPFEDWLLSDEKLAPEQSRDLQDHLRACDRCRQLEAGLGSIAHLFHTAPAAAPAPGFTQRWQTRLAAQNLARQRRQTWVLFFLMTVVSLVLLAWLGGQIVETLRSPVQIQLLKALYLSMLAAIVRFGQSIQDIARQIALGLPLLGLVAFTGITSFLCALWVVAYQQLTSASRRIEV